jgi:predicted transcriptional regulator
MRWSPWQEKTHRRELLKSVTDPAICFRLKKEGTRSMEVHFTPEQEQQLAQIAASTGTAPEALVRDAAMRLLREDARLRAAVREGLAQADRGEFIEEGEMDTRFEEMLRS